MRSAEATPIGSFQLRASGWVALANRLLEILSQVLAALEGWSRHAGANFSRLTLSAQYVS